MARWYEKNSVATALVVLAFVSLVAWLIPFTHVFEFDTDEGVNLAKGALVARGYPLYSQIWSDQPPLVSWILGLVFLITGPSVLAGRFVILAFAALLIGSFFLLIRRDTGLWPAVGGTVLLAVSGYTALLSAMIRIGMVSLSLLVASLCLWRFSLDSGRGPRWAFISGVLSGWSILAKLFTLPVVLLLLWQACRSQRRRPWLWGLATGLLPIIVIGTHGWEQLLRPHVLAYQSVMPGQHSPIYYLHKDFFLYLLAMIGLGIRFHQRDKFLSVIGGWFLFGIGLVLFHRPLFVHHILLLTIPAAWLSTDALRAGLSWKKQATVLLVASLASGKCYALWVDKKIELEHEISRAPIREQLYNDMVKYSGGSPWVLTDRPTYAIRAGLLVPPEIAVLSMKRMRAADYGHDWLPSVLEKYRIPQIVFARYTTYPQSVMDAIAQNYVRITRPNAFFAHYVRRDLAPNSANSTTK